MDDPVGGDDVLLHHHLDTVDRQAVAVAADLDAVALQGLVGGAQHDALGALDRVEEVVVQQRCSGESGRTIRNTSFIATTGCDT